MINENEINELLNLKFEEMDELDLGDDQSFPSKDIRDSTEVNPRLRKIIQDIPPGQAGITFLNNSAIVKETEQLLADTLNSEFDKNPYKKSFAQLHAEERTPIYKQQIEEQYRVSMKQTINLYHQLKIGNSVSYKGIARIVAPFVKYLEEDRAIVQNLATYITDENDYLFNHLTRVCLLSINIAAHYGLSKKEVVEVGVSALLADIGMTLIDSKIRTKRGRLNDQEQYEVQKHPILGLYALEKVEGIPPRVKFVAYQHHERNNGKGYPKRRKGALIHLYSKIVAVADVFEALCSERTYRIPYNPADALNKVIKMAEMELLDTEVVECFVQCVSKYPVGCLVQLSDNSLAKVVASNPHDTGRPIIARFTASNGRYIDESEIREFDLSHDTNIEIEKVLDLKIRQNELMMGF